MKISCTPISCSGMMKNGMDQNEYFRFIAAAGAEGSDLLDPACYPWFWQDFPRQRKDVRQRLADAGLALSGLATGNNFAQPEPDAFLAQVELVKNAIRLAAETEAPCLRIFGGYTAACGGDPSICRSNGLELVARGIAAVLPEAERCGVTLALENHGCLPGLCAEMQAFCSRFQSKYFRLLFDFANFTSNSMDEMDDALKAFKILQSNVVHCHVKSWQIAPPESGRRVIGAVAGEGGLVPLQQFFYLLAETGYQGFCSLEYEAGVMTPEAEGVPRSLQNLIEMRNAAVTVQDIINGRV